MEKINEFSYMTNTTKIVLTRRAVHGEDGATKVLLSLANELDKRGYDVYVVVFKKPKRKPFYKINNSIKILKCKIPRTSRTSRVLQGMLTITRLNKFLEKIERPRGLAGWVMYYIWRLENNDKITSFKSVMNKVDPDVVFSFYTKTYFFTAVACNEMGIPLVRSNQNDVRIYRTRMGNMYEVLESKAQADGVTVLDTFFLDYIKKSDVERCKVIPNTVDSSFYNIESEGGRKHVVLSVGRLTEQKNPLFLIDAFRYVLEHYPEWELHFYGVGSLEGLMEKKIKEYGLCDSIYLKGVSSDIIEAYNSASILAFPSRYEGFGLVLIEAMATGLPSVVIEDCLPPARFVSESGAGLVTKNSTEEYAKSLMVLMESKELRIQLGDKAKSYAKRYQSKKVYDSWEDLLQTVLLNNR